MSKVRVYELAKELGIESKEAVARLRELGEFVKSPSSSIEAPVAKKLREAYPATPPEQPTAAAPSPSTTSAKPAPRPTAKPAKAPKDDTTAAPAAAATPESKAASTPAPAGPATPVAPGGPGPCRRSRHHTGPSDPPGPSGDARPGPCSAGGPLGRTARPAGPRGPAGTGTGGSGPGDTAADQRSSRARRRDPGTATQCRSGQRGHAGWTTPATRRQTPEWLVPAGQ